MMVTSQNDLLTLTTSIQESSLEVSCCTFLDWRLVELTSSRNRLKFSLYFLKSSFTRVLKLAQSEILKKMETTD